jgi:hypothetical protein
MAQGPVAQGVPISLGAVRVSADARSSGFSKIYRGRFGGKAGTAAPAGIGQAKTGDGETQATVGQRSAAASRQWNLSNSYGPRTAELETDQAVTAWWVLGLRWTGPGSADGLAPAGNEPVALPHPFRAPADRAWPRCRQGRSPTE